MIIVKNLPGTRSHCRYYIFTDIAKSREYFFHHRHRRRSLPSGYVFACAEEKVDRHTRSRDQSGHVCTIHMRTEMPKVAATAEKESEREFPFAAYAAAGRTL